MAWTYSDPGTSDRDAVRFAIGDTDADDPLLQDSEILYCLSQGGSVLAGSAMAARRGAAKLAREFDRNIDGLSTKRSQRHAQLLQIAEELEKEVKRAGLRFTYPASVGRVQDSENFPPLLEMADTSGPEWDDESKR